MLLKEERKSSRYQNSSSESSSDPEFSFIDESTSICEKKTSDPNSFNTFFHPVDQEKSNMFQSYVMNIKASKNLCKFVKIGPSSKGLNTKMLKPKHRRAYNPVSNDTIKDGSPRPIYSKDEFKCNRNASEINLSAKPFEAQLKISQALREKVQARNRTRIRTCKSLEASKFSRWTSTTREKVLQGFIKKANKILSSQRSEFSASFNRDVFKTNTTIKTIYPTSVKKMKSSEKLSTQFDTRSNINSGIGVEKFDPKAYVTNCNTIKTIGSLKKAKSKLLNINTTSRKVATKSRAFPNKTERVPRRINHRDSSNDDIPKLLNADLYYDQSNFSSNITLKSFIKNEQKSQNECSDHNFSKMNSKNSSFASIVCKNIEKNRKSRVIHRIHQNNQIQKSIAKNIVENSLKVQKKRNKSYEGTKIPRIGTVRDKNPKRQDKLDLSNKSKEISKRKHRKKSNVLKPPTRDPKKPMKSTKNIPDKKVIPEIARTCKKRKRCYTPVVVNLKNNIHKQATSLSIRSSSQNFYRDNDQTNKERLVFDCNIFSQNGEIESNLVCEIESNTETFPSALPSSRVLPQKHKKEDDNAKIYPSEFSTFSYQPQFIRPMSNSQKDGDENTPKPELKRSQCKRFNAAQKVTNTGHSLTYIKSLPGELKMKLQNSANFTLKEIKVYSKRPEIIRNVSIISSELAKAPLRSHRSSSRIDIEDKENVKPGYTTSRMRD
ncbi:unnamed protein product [Moneuplotes crassus]|uniref:Uncharacterized protein n=1 Tax=Euplotes crassus TaxID=5936 RepID=A0AAD1Y2M3_EUPCR|nr:unnamed protein product [Moneuplotes crassus]